VLWLCVLDCSRNRVPSADEWWLCLGFGLAHAYFLCTLDFGLDYWFSPYLLVTRILIAMACDICRTFFRSSDDMKCTGAGFPGRRWPGISTVTPASGESAAPSAPPPATESPDRVCRMPLPLLLVYLSSRSELHNW